MKMKGTLLLLLSLLLIGTRVVKAQAVTFATPYAYAVTGTLANCPVLSTIPVGTGIYCSTNTGPYFAKGGDTVWTSLLPVATVAGVTSIMVCNEAGASCGAPQNGAVQLDIPKSATLN